MALLSNINDKFAVDSTGAIQFNGQVGTSGYVLKSNANAAPTWVDPSTVIGGPYLPLTGGTLTGALAGTSATFSDIIYSSGGFRTGSTNSSYNLLTRNNNNGSYPLYCQNSLGVSGDAAIARFAYGSYGANTGTAVLDIRSGTSYFNDCNLGIGTPTPDANLEVVGTTVISTASDGVNAVLIGLAGSNRTTIQFDTADTTHTNRQWGLTNIAGDFYIGRHGLNVMTMKNDGNVGIGNDNPQTNLTIGSAQGNSLEFTYDSTNGYRNIISNHWDSSTDTRMDFNIGRTGNVAPVPVMSVGYGGNVGIGTTSPTKTLQVDGSIGLTTSATDGTKRLHTYPDDWHSWYYKSSVVNNQSAEVMTYYQQFLISYRDTTPVFIIRGSSGNVGIGTTAPTQPLDVDGYSICDKQFQRDNTLLTILNTPRVLNIGYRGANGTYTFDPTTLFGSLAQGGQCTLEVTGWRAALNNGIIHWTDNGGNTNIGNGQVYYTQTAYRAGGQSGSNLISVSNNSGTNNITITFTGWHSNSHGWNCKIISYQA